MNRHEEKVFPMYKDKFNQLKKEEQQFILVVSQVYFGMQPVDTIDYYNGKR